jgi:hypothetical protein
VGTHAITSSKGRRWEKLLLSSSFIVLRLGAFRLVCVLFRGNRRARCGERGRDRRTHACGARPKYLGKLEPPPPTEHGIRITREWTGSYASKIEMIQPTIAQVGEFTDPTRVITNYSPHNWCPPATWAVRVYKTKVGIVLSAQVVHSFPRLSEQFVRWRSRRNNGAAMPTHVLPR